MITPDAVEGLSPGTGEMTRWMGTAASSGIGSFRDSSPLPNGKEPAYTDMPGTSDEWRTDQGRDARAGEYQPCVRQTSTRTKQGPSYG